jgi:hypothetical protein
MWLDVAATGWVVPGAQRSRERAYLCAVSRVVKGVGLTESEINCCRGVSTGARRVRDGRPRTCGGALLAARRRHARQSRRPTAGRRVDVEKAIDEAAANFTDEAGSVEDLAADESRVGEHGVDAFGAPSVWAIAVVTPSARARSTSAPTTAVAIPGYSAPAPRRSRFRRCRPAAVACSRRNRRALNVSSLAARASSHSTRADLHHARDSADRAMSSRWRCRPATVPARRCGKVALRRR